jgi:hypothetical protein
LSYKKPVLSAIVNRDMTSNRTLDVPDRAGVALP